MFGSLCTSWTWVAISFPRFGRFSAIISRYLLGSLLSLLLLGLQLNKHEALFIESYLSLLLVSVFFILLTLPESRFFFLSFPLVHKFSLQLHT